MSVRSSPIRFTDSWASVHFDLLRGIAALLVLVGHWRNLFFIDYPEIVHHRIWFAVPYTIAGVGHQSVILFFILSGYFISGSVFRSLERSQWGWDSYLARRLIRLWVVLLPALLLCLFWDRLGIHLGHAPALYAGQVPNHMLLDVPTLLGPRIFFGNLFFLQSILTPVYGSDGALWSLANEFWYYILFPLGLIALWRSAPAKQRIVCILLFVAVASFVGIGMLSGFAIWLLGVALFKLRPPSFEPRTARNLRTAATVVYFTIFFALGRVRISEIINDYFLAIVTLPYLWLLLSDTRRFDPRLRRVRGSRELARFSYTLYTVHTPLLVFLVSLTLGERRWVPTPIHILEGLGVMLLALGYAYGVAFLFEFRTDGIRQFIERVLGIRDRPAALPSNPMSTP